MMGAEGLRGGQGRYCPGGVGEQSLILEDQWIILVRPRSSWVARVTDTRGAQMIRSGRPGYK